MAQFKMLKICHERHKLNVIRYIAITHVDAAQFKGELGLFLLPFLREHQ